MTDNNDEQPEDLQPGGSANSVEELGPEAVPSAAEAPSDASSDAAAAVAAPAAEASSGSSTTTTTTSSTEGSDADSDDDEEEHTIVMASPTPEEIEAARIVHEAAEEAKALAKAKARKPVQKEECEDEEIDNPGKGCYSALVQELETAVLDTSRRPARQVSIPQSGKLDTFDWASDFPAQGDGGDYVEVTFKNTRKGYYRNTNGLPLKKGDIVAVEATPGHDIGRVSLTGPLVAWQMRARKACIERGVSMRVYRVARPNDIDLWNRARSMEHTTMLRSRQIAEQLHLKMKIGDVEYQGDGQKAIFYYIADERVDFRQLIKCLGDEFGVKIEMRQIGARQEAGRIGGLGPCGRPLCCSTWMSNFLTVSTSAAKFQEMSMNPQKLAGQCAKLKCCLNYEADAYYEAQKEFPGRDVVLEAKDSNYYFFKADIFGRTMQFSTDPHQAIGVVTLSLDRVKQIIALNKEGQKAEALAVEQPRHGHELSGLEDDYRNVVGQDDLTRFDRERGGRSRDGRDGRGDRDAQPRGVKRRDGAKPQNKPQQAKNDSQNSLPDAAQTPAQAGAGNNNGAGAANRENRGRDNREGREGRGDRPRGDNRNRDGRGRGNRDRTPSGGDANTKAPGPQGGGNVGNTQNGSENAD